MYNCSWHHFLNDFYLLRHFRHLQQVSLTSTFWSFDPSAEVFFQTLSTPSLGSYGRGEAPFTHLVCLLPFVSYLAGCKSVYARLGSNYITAMISQSGKDLEKRHILSCWGVAKMVITLQGDETKSEDFGRSGAILLDNVHEKLI